MPLPTSDIERMTIFKPQKPAQLGIMNRVRLWGMRFAPTLTSLFWHPEPEDSFIRTL